MFLKMEQEKYLVTATKGLVASTKRSVAAAKFWLQLHNFICCA